MTNNNTKTLNILLWVAQGLLALTFGMSGFMKVSVPLEQLAQNGMSFVNSFGATLVRLIGISELLAALGLLLPTALRIKPSLTPLAAGGLALIMILATGYHISHNEPFLPTVILFAIAIFIVWGRTKKAVIQPK